MKNPFKHKHKFTTDGRVINGLFTDKDIVAVSWTCKCGYERLHSYNSNPRPTTGFRNTTTCFCGDANGGIQAPYCDICGGSEGKK